MRTSGSGTAPVSAFTPISQVSQYESSVTFTAAPIVGPKA